MADHREQAQESFGLAQGLTVGLPITAGFIGYLITYWMNIRLERYKRELQFISDQIQHLYGPLSALIWTAYATDSTVAATEGDSKYYTDSYMVVFFDEGYGPRTAQDIWEYRLWATRTLMPIFVHIQKVITENAHLIEGPDMPGPLINILRFIAAYRRVIESWPDKDTKADATSEELMKQSKPPLPYPTEFPEYVNKALYELKRRQQILLGLICGKT